MRKHTCHWPGCPKEVTPALWGCQYHWYRLPKLLRDAIWKEYRPGQEVDKKPSIRYLVVATLVQGWIAGKVVIWADGVGFDVLEDLPIFGDLRIPRKERDGHPNLAASGPEKSQ